MSEVKNVAIGGLGAIGAPVARALVAGALPGLRLSAVSSRDETKARRCLGDAGNDVDHVSPAALADGADIVIECLPAGLFDDVAVPAVEAGRLLVVLSAGALLTRGRLIEMARDTGARILVPTGAILGLDALRAAAEGEIESVRITTRKPPAGLAGAPYIETEDIDLAGLGEATLIYSGSVSEAVGHFPANVNVAAAVSLAGIGPDRTTIDVWAVPGLSRNSQSVTVTSDCTTFTVTIESVPSPDNPRTSLMTPRSVIAALRRLSDSFVVGT